MKSFRRVLIAAACIVTISLVTGGVVFQQNIWDWNRLRSYRPDSSIASLADNTAMTPKARNIFYVYYPALDDKTEFVSHCPVQERTIVLGCYVPRQAIYVLDVTDSRLDGIHEVTAAHEMLHAAYERLSGKEKTRINSLLDTAFAGLDDPRIASLVETYRKQDPSVVHNELHSILGTEAKSLPDELEAYYKRYFTDRQRVVSYSEKYEQVFADMKNQLDKLEASLKEQHSQIADFETALKAQVASLEETQRQLNALKSSGNLRGYNALVDSYNPRVREYNAGVQQYKLLIQQYNKDVATYNALAADQRSLVESLDVKIQEKQ